MNASKKPQWKKQQLKKRRLKKEADRLWHIAVIKEYGDDCFFRNDYKRAENCNGKTSKAHHYKPKGNYGHLRYEILNGVPACWPCHYKMEQKDSSMVAEIRHHRGTRWFNKIEEMAKNRPKRSYQTISYYQDQTERLKKIALKESE